MAAYFTIKQGDTLPTLRVVLKNNEDLPIDLTQADQVSLVMGKHGFHAKVHQLMTIDNAVAGEVSYSWSLDDTDEVGTFNAVFEIKYPTGDILTVPTHGYETIVVTDDLFRVPITEEIIDIGYIPLGGGKWHWNPRIVDAAKDPIEGASVTVYSEWTDEEFGPVLTQATGYPSTALGQPMFILNPGDYTTTVETDGRTITYRFAINAQGDEVKL